MCLSLFLILVGKGKTGEVPNLVSWEFKLESVACKVLRWPVKFQDVPGKFQNLASSLGTISLK